MTGGLRRSQAIGQAASLLLEGGFVKAGEVSTSSGVDVRIFEDRRSIVGVCFFERWSELKDSWISAQAVLSERISKHFSRTDPKSWEGYLVLLTSEEGVSVEKVAQIRRNTNRLRKLVATGSELQSIEAVRMVLLPVLPLEFSGIDSSSESLLERLPEMLEAAGIEFALAEAAVGAFVEGRSPMEGVRDWRCSS